MDTNASALGEAALIPRRIETRPTLFTRPLGDVIPMTIIDVDLTASCPSEGRAMSAARRPSCVSSHAFDPDDLFAKWANGDAHPTSSDDNDFRGAIIRAFNLPANDTYVYHAIASVTLTQVQTAINAGAQHGLHAWYPESASPPGTADIDAYTSIFASTTVTPKALNAFSSNAKKDSVRARVAANLGAKRHVPTTFSVFKRKQPHINPYLDFWAWSCRALEWCGPEEATEGVKQSHHVLPVFYHHFGCAVPSYETLECVRQYAAGRSVIDAGSGNGYWSYLLRRMGLETVAIDDGTSVWRVMWVGDTVKADAAKYLDQKKGAGEMVLLMVYPQVTTGFTRETLRAYKGNTVIVAGTQNGNRFTADVGALMGSEWKKEIQIPLPSFAGKDDAVFVWQKEVA